MAASRRAGRVGSLWVAAERLPEVLAVNPARVDFAPPPSRAARAWTREEAIVELLRGRLSFIGPTTAEALARSLDIQEREADAALIKLENEGVVLRGRFVIPSVSEGSGRAGADDNVPPDAQVARYARDHTQWCDRRLLARIHRYTLNRLRAEIEPVAANDFMRFLFAWQHVASSSRLTGIDGLRAVVAQLDGYEIAMNAWERHVLPQRIEKYESSMLDMLCLTGEVSWAHLSTGVAIFLRSHGSAWLEEIAPPELSEKAQFALDILRTRGASFTHDIGDAEALDELVNAGLITSDGFAGRREAGRWSILTRGERNIEAQAWAFLRRYGVVFRRIVAREPNSAPWRELARVYRRLEARGEIRGGRFVNGMSGEQFALGEAVDRLREIRREGGDGSLIVISAADPLNLTGILTTGDRVRAIPSNRIAYRDGVAVSTMEGDCLRPLADLDEANAMHVAAALAGRRVPVTSGFVGRV